MATAVEVVPVIRAYLIAALAVLLLAGFAGRAAYRAGYHACQVEQAAALEDARAKAARAAELASRKEADRLAAAAQAALLAQEMEDMANADPVGAPECLSADRVRRLNRR